MELGVVLQEWDLSLSQVRDRMYDAERPRERERWHALWLLGQGWSQKQVAAALDRETHTIGDWLEAFRQQGPAGLRFERSGGSPPSWIRRSKRS